MSTEIQTQGCAPFPKSETLHSNEPHLPVSRENKQTSSESIFPNKSKKEKVIMKQKQKDILKRAKIQKGFFCLFGKGEGREKKRPLLGLGPWNLG